MYSTGHYERDRHFVKDAENVLIVGQIVFLARTQVLNVASQITTWLFGSAFKYDSERRPTADYRAKFEFTGLLVIKCQSNYLIMAKFIILMQRIDKEPEIIRMYPKQFVHKCQCIDTVELELKRTGFSESYIIKLATAYQILHESFYFSMKQISVITVACSV